METFIDNPRFSSNDFKVPIDFGFTDSERWVWEKICNGEVADFNARYGKYPDPRNIEGWTEDRVLRPQFLEIILFHESCKNVIHRKGLRIIGAWVNEYLDLSNGGVTTVWSMDKSRFEKEVNLESLKTSSKISFSKSFFNEALSLYLGKIGLGLDLRGTKINSMLNLEALSVDGYLFLGDGSEFNEVSLVTAKVGGMVNLCGTRVHNRLNMNSITVGSTLLLAEKQENKSEFHEITLIDSRINGNIQMSYISVIGPLKMRYIKVDGSIFLGAGEFKEIIQLNYAVINGNFLISISNLNQLSIDSTTIRGEFKLGYGDYKPIWNNDSLLYSRNTQVGVLQDGGEDSWPKNVELVGFTFSRLGGPDDSKNHYRKIDCRDAEWYIDWLATNRDYSPQPYQHLASVLVSMGHSEKANSILYAAKNLERQEAYKKMRLGKWAWLSLLKWFIGFGIGLKYFRSLVWVFILTALGAFVFISVERNIPTPLMNSIGFSFDLLLPIIELDKRHALDFYGWQLYYFYFHELMGFLLGSFIVAGLSGITKK